MRRILRVALLAALVSLVALLGAPDLAHAATTDASASEVVGSGSIPVAAGVVDATRSISAASSC